MLKLFNFFIVHDLIQYWNEKSFDYGVNERGQAANMKLLRIYDVLAAKQSVFHLATTVACTILKSMAIWWKI